MDTSHHTSTPALIRRPHDLDRPAQPELRYGQDAHGVIVGWRLAANQPHALIVTPASHCAPDPVLALIVDALAQGIEVAIATPAHMMDTRGLRALPGVTHCATDPADVAAVVEELHDLMLIRYRAIQRGDITPAELGRVLFVWRGSGPLPAKVAALITHGRMAHIHVALSLTRATARHLSGQIRDLLQHRITLPDAGPTDQAIVHRGRTVTQAQIWTVPPCGTPGEWDRHDRALIAQLMLSHY